MKVRDVVERVREDGWFLVRTRGSHAQYKHQVKRGLVTIAGQPGDEVHPKTLKSICRQAQIEIGETH